MRIIFFLFILLAQLSWAKTPVALVLDGDMCPATACLHGHYKKGTKVLLMSKKSEQTCSGKVGKKFIVDYEPGKFEAVEINGLKKCKLSSEDFYLAILGRGSGKYKIFSAQEVEQEKVNKLDSILKKNKVFSTAWGREVFYKKAGKSKVAYKLNDYKKLKAVGLDYAISKKYKLQILKHQFTDGSLDGIHFAFYQDRWSTVSSTFTEGEPLVFSLDGRVFVAIKATCQKECGYIDHEVYEFNGRVFKLIYNNADLSS